MNWLRSKYEANFLAWDFCGALCVSAAGLIAINFLSDFKTFSEWFGPVKSQLYGGVFSLAGALLGFVLSAAAMVIAFEELPRFKILKDSGHARSIVVVYFDSMRWLGALTGVSLAALLFDTAASASVAFLYAVGFIALVSALRVYRCIWILKRLAFIAANQKSSPPRDRLVA